MSSICDGGGRVTLRRELLRRACFWLAIVLLLLLCPVDGARGKRPTPVFIRQLDFEGGTYIIREPGFYQLQEDIVFSPAVDSAPAAYDKCWPEEAAALPAAFALGFFAAITIETDNVELDLAGFTIEQSEEHRLLQRFFSVIELANSPFIPGQGPADFVADGEFRSAKGVRIHTGRIGRASHHGIHGNMNRDVHIHDVTFDGFEVAGIGLNGVDGLLVERCTMTNAADVPVLGTFSSARFLRPYLDHLAFTSADITLRVRGERLTPSSVRNAVVTAMDTVFADVVRYGAINCAEHPGECALFDNPTRVVDGNCYGLQIHHAGLAVNGFPVRPLPSAVPSRDVVIDNVHISGVHCTVREVVGIVKNGGIVSDSVGAIVQLLNKDVDGRYVSIANSNNGEGVNSISDAYYIGNPVLDAQLLIAKAIHMGLFDATPLSVRRNGITPDIVAWAEKYKAGRLGDITATEGWQCNGDSMAHVQKGALGMKLDAAIDVYVSRSSVDNVYNTGAVRSPMCGDYIFSHPLATLPGYGGAWARGITIAGSSNVLVHGVDVTNVVSDYGGVCGFCVLTDSNAVAMHRVSAARVTSSSGGPAVGFFIGAAATDVRIGQWCTADVATPVYDASGSAAVARGERRHGGKACSRGGELT